MPDGTVTEFSEGSSSVKEASQENPLRQRFTEISELVPKLQTFPSLEAALSDVRVEDTEIIVKNELLDSFEQHQRSYVNDIYSSERASDLIIFNSVVRLYERENGRIREGITVEYFYDLQGVPVISIQQNLGEHTTITQIFNTALVREPGEEPIYDREGRLRARKVLLTNTDSGVTVDFLSVVDSEIYSMMRLSGLTLDRTRNINETLEEKERHRKRFNSYLDDNVLEYSSINSFADLAGFSHEVGHFLEERNNASGSKVKEAIGILDSNPQGIPDDLYQLGRIGFLDNESSASLYAIAILKQAKKVGALPADDFDGETMIWPLSESLDRYSDRFKPRTEATRDFYCSSQHNNFLDLLNN